ncbi:MAG TPA: AraC family transcriptional regulator [Steroidobacteraceae bacterium]|nr:AraC family transcriptional regulator [Steroidobacteraceae bacterium]
MGEHIRYYSFPIMGVEPMSASTARSYPRHTHDQYGIGLVDSGGHASWSGRGAVEAGPGDFICVNPGEVHDGRALAHRPRTWRILYFDPSLVQHLHTDIAEVTATSFMFVKPVFLDERLRRIFNSAFGFVHEREAAESDNLGCETAILMLVAGLRAHSTAVPGRSQRPTPCIRRARARIDDDPTARQSLGDLAQEAGVSRYQLLRGFARELGLTPHAYVLQRRIAMARRLLRAGSSLSEAALASGFCDQSHLNRVFLRQFGVTPGRYASHSD